MPEALPPAATVDRLPETVRHTFRHYYPFAPLEAVSYRKLPIPAAQHFEDRSRRFIYPLKHKTNDFYLLFHIGHPDSTDTWAAWRKTIVHGDQPYMETFLYFWESSTFSREL